MNRLLLLAILMSLTTSTATEARARDVVWDVQGCEEAAVLFPSQVNGGVLVVLAYHCDHATIGDTRLRNISVSEISVLHADSTFTLLRQVTDSPELHDGLRALGMKDSFLGRIEYSAGSSATAPQFNVSFAKTNYSLTGAGAVSPIPPQPTTGGASYTYEGSKGTIRVSYANHSQSVSGGIMNVDAGDDRRLREWMGSEQASGPAMIALGDWTGTAALTDQ